MKHVKGLIGLGAALAMVGFANPVHADREDPLHIRFMSGNVQVETEDTGYRVPANRPLRVRDRQ
jgi:hypothetical protein